jgi:hypothetical protein
MKGIDIRSCALARLFQRVAHFPRVFLNLALIDLDHVAQLRVGWVEDWRRAP